MNRRRSTLALALCISIVGVCAFGASNSSAIWVHECIKGEGIGTGTVYEAGCKKAKVLGGWETVPITSVKPAVTKWTAPWWLRWLIGGVKVKVECKSLTGEGNTENVEVGGVHKVLGSEIKLALTECAVTEPAEKGCKAEPISTSVLKSETSGLKSIYSPVSGSKIGAVTISGCSISALNGSKEITGNVIGINEEATPETTEVTEATKSELKIGGVAATIFGSFHIATKASGAVLTLELP